MFHNRRALVLFLAFGVCVESAFAQEIPTKPTFLVVPSGIQRQITLAYALNPDCSSKGTIVARIVQKPKNGELRVANEEGFSSYAKDDQRYKCNEKRSEVVKLYYTSDEGFKGKDRFVVEVFYANGSYRKRVFNVNVR